MPIYVAKSRGEIDDRQGQKDRDGARVLVLGVTFKENHPDIRNSKVIGIVRESLKSLAAMWRFGIRGADPKEVQREYGLSLTEPSGHYDAIVLAVAHREFANLDIASMQNGPRDCVRCKRCLTARNGGMEGSEYESARHGNCGIHRLPCSKAPS